MNNARNIAIAIIAVTGLSIFGTAVYRSCTARRPHVEVERERFPVMGIDLSAHNGDVNFDRIVAEGVDFVFQRLQKGHRSMTLNFERIIQMRGGRESRSGLIISSDSTATDMIRAVIFCRQSTVSVSTCRWR